MVKMARYLPQAISVVTPKGKPFRNAEVEGYQSNMAKLDIVVAESGIGGRDLMDSDKCYLHRPHNHLMCVSYRYENMRFKEPCTMHPCARRAWVVGDSCIILVVFMLRTKLSSLRGVNKRDDQT